MTDTHLPATKPANPACVHEPTPTHLDHVSAGLNVLLILCCWRDCWRPHTAAAGATAGAGRLLLLLRARGLQALCHPGHGVGARAIQQAAIREEPAVANSSGRQAAAVRATGNGRERESLAGPTLAGMQLGGSALSERLHVWQSHTQPPTLTQCCAVRPLATGHTVSHCVRVGG
jgi:hypothetical protein